MLFLDPWLELPQLKDWLVKVSNNDTRAYCRCCGVVLRAYKPDLISHSLAQRHVNNWNSGKMCIRPGAMSVQLLSNIDDSKLKNESSDKKRPVYAKKYRLEWEEIPELANWLAQSINTGKAYCKVCQVELRAHKHDLIIHARSLKHKKLEESREEERSLDQRIENNNNYSMDQNEIENSEDIKSPVQFLSTSFDISINNSRNLRINRNNMRNSRHDQGNEEQDSNIEYEDYDSSEDKSFQTYHATRHGASITKCSISKVNDLDSPENSSFKKRKFQLNEIVSAIENNEFSIGELKTIIKAAAQKL